MTVSITRREHLKRAAAGLAATTAFAQTRVPVRLIVLDVGGTIVEDRGDVPESLRLALAGGGITVTASEIAGLRGASKRTVVRHFVELRSGRNAAEQAGLIESVYRDFSARIMEAYRSVPPIRGAEDAFAKLRARGILLATNTGFDGPITASIFKRLGWEKYFDAVITSDDVKDGRPAPYMIFHAMETAGVENVRDVMAVGDTPLDLQAGTNSGARAVVGVLSGVGTEGKLRAEPHTHIVRSVADLPDFVDRAG